MSKLILLLLLHVNFLWSQASTNPINLFSQSQFIVSSLEKPLEFETIQSIPPADWLNSLRVKPLTMSQEVWIKVSLTNTTLKPMTRVLYSSLTVSDQVDFYVTSKEGVLLSHAIAGDTRPYTSHAMKSRYPATLLSLDPNETQIIYTRISSIGRISLVLFESGYETFLAMENQEATIFGIFIGMMMIVFIYYLSLFIKSRRIYMLYYGLYVLVVFAYMSGLFHLGHSLVPESLSLFYGQGFRGFLSLSYICLGLFVYTFLPPKQWWMKWGIILFWLILLVHSLSIFLAYMYKPLALTALDTISLLIHFPYIVFLFTYSLVSSIKKNVLAHYITIAMGVTLIAVMFVGAALLGFLILPSMLLHSLFMGAIVVDMVCFIMAYQHQEELLEQKLIHAEHIMFEQSKRVAIGTMLGNVTHQWKQPLGRISSLLMSYEAQRFVKKPFTKKAMDEMVYAIKDTVTHLGDTIGSFNAFFTLEKENKPFLLDDAIKVALAFVEDKITLANIKVFTDIEAHHTLIGSRNGLVNIVLILLQNSLENFQEKRLNEGSIYIKSSLNEGTIILEFSDNGGGICIEPTKIFEPYVSSKEKGSGSGLFIASWIIKEHFDGSITASNEDKNAIFKLIFPQDAKHTQHLVSL